MHYQELEVWREAVAFASAVYSLTSSFPKDERYGLTSQVRRAAVSISLNIAEGNGRGTLKDYRHFVDIARGSLYEVETCLTIAEDLGLANNERLQALRAHAVTVGKLLSGTRRSISSRLNE